MTPKTEELRGRRQRLPKGEVGGSRLSRVISDAGGSEAVEHEEWNGILLVTLVDETTYLVRATR